MSAWIISLPFLIGLALAVGMMVAVGFGSYVLTCRFPADTSDESAIKVSDHIRRVVGVLLGLMLSTVFALASGRALKIQDSVEVEAEQLGDLYHDLARLESKEADAIQESVTQYMAAVSQNEWPALARGETYRSTDRMFRTIEDRSVALSAKTESEKSVKSRLLQNIDKISCLRQGRVYSASPGLDWTILLVVLAFGLLMTTFRF